jgi:endoglucanase
MKKFWILALSLMALVHSVAGAKKSPPIPAESQAPLKWLHTESASIIDEDGNAKILLGVNRSGLEYDKKGNKINEEEIRFICQEWKAQIIRIPFNEEWILQDPKYNRFLDRVIGWINRCGAYVLLDLQWQDVKVKIPKIPDEKAAGMWALLADRYRDNPGVLYDIHNETHDTTWSAWRGRASEIITAIRQKHPRSLIFVSGLDWAYDLRGWAESPLPFPNIVYSTHPYPFKGEPWAWDKYFGDFREKFPIFAGEFGGGEKDLDWGAKLIDYFNAKRIGWTAWSWVDQPHLTRKDRRTPTPFGELVKAALFQNAEVKADTTNRCLEKN